MFALLAGATLLAQDQHEGFRFRSGDELVNVTATVTDARGRFVPGLRREDFVVYEDGREQAISHFANERVPVSLGLAIDTSGSMSGEKWDSARAAIDRFLLELLAPDDEVFLYRFSDAPDLVQPWTTDRQRLSRGLARISPRGGTALYDTVAEAIPLAQAGHHRKKALLLISDGNDTNSSIRPQELSAQVRETEVLVYAIGIDGQSDEWTRTPQRGPSYPPASPPRFPVPFPYPGGGGRPPQSPPQYPPRTPMGGSSGGYNRRGDDRVNVPALRSLTDDSGGRTEVIRDARDLDPATAGIAHELSQQYYLGYSSTAPKDGRWHSIELQVRGDRGYHVRSRRGYVATRGM